MKSDISQQLTDKLLLLFLFFLFINFINVPQVLAQNYDLEEVFVEPYFEEIRRTGKLDFKRTLTLSFKSSGYLSRLTVDEGDAFKAEQLLAALVTTELIEEKNASYAELLQAKRDVNRIKKLIDKQLSSEQELDIANTRVETTRARYKVAYYNLDKAQIQAPFDGVVLARHTELGEFQTPGKEVLQVAALKNNWIAKVALTGREISLVDVGQKVIVHLNQLGAVKGVISKVPAMANTQGHLFMIEVLLPQLTLDKGIAAGQIVEVVINFTGDQYIYRMPIEALNGVDATGKALVIVERLSQESLLKNSVDKFAQQAFDILRLDNAYVYLRAEQNDQPLKIITRGWQHISLSGQ